MPMIKLTRPDGIPIEVRADAIDEIYVNDGTMAGKAVLVIAGQHQSVLETVQQIDAILGASA